MPPGPAAPSTRPSPAGLAAAPCRVLAPPEARNAALSARRCVPRWYAQELEVCPTCTDAYERQTQIAAHPQGVRSGSRCQGAEHLHSLRHAPLFPAHARRRLRRRRSGTSFLIHTCACRMPWTQQSFQAIGCSRAAGPGALGAQQVHDATEQVCHVQMSLHSLSHGRCSAAGRALGCRAEH